MNKKSYPGKKRIAPDTQVKSPEVMGKAKKVAKKRGERIIDVNMDEKPLLTDFSTQKDAAKSLPVVAPSQGIEVYQSQLPVHDPLRLYLRELSRYPLLSSEQEVVLTKALKETGDIEIAKNLVQSNLRLVVKIAMEYRHAHNNIMDLIQEGNMGLMKAVSKYDPDRGAKLSYYASWWIRSYILKYLLDNFRLVRMGTTHEQKKLFYNLLREKERLLQQGIKSDTKMLSENLGVSEKAVNLMDQRLSSGSGEVSIDTPVDGADGPSLMELIPNDEEPIDESLGKREGLEILESQLASFLDTLGERDRDIFQKRLLSEVPPSLQEIADGFGVSRERVRQIEERLVNKLRVYMADFLG